MNPWNLGIHGAARRVISWIFKQGVISKLLVLLRLRELTSTNNFAVLCTTVCLLGTSRYAVYSETAGVNAHECSRTRVAASSCVRKSSNQISPDNCAAHRGTFNSRNNVLIVSIRRIYTRFERSPIGSDKKIIGYLGRARVWLNLRKL